MSGSAPTGDRPAPPSLATALRGGGAARRRARRDPDAPGVLRAAVPDRDALVDLGFAALLCTIALVGMRTGFLGVEWVVAAGVGLVLGLLIGHLAGTFRWMALTTFLVLTATYFLLGGPVAVRDNLVGGVIPTPQTFVDLAEWAVTGWKKWLTLLPPVDARGPVVALPWLAGLLGGALTLGLARRWANVPLTAVAPIALLAASIAFGTSQPAALLVQGVGFAAVLVAWLVVRAHRSRPPVQNGAGRGVRIATGAALVLVALLAGTFASPALPGTSASDRREVVRTRLVPPLDVTQFASPLPGFRRYTEPNDAKLYDQTVLNVQGMPRGAIVRFATLDHYDGLVWGAADRSSDGVPFQQVGSRIAAGSAGDPVDVEVTVPDGGYVGNWLPTVGDPTRIEFSGPRADELADELWLNTDTDTAVVPAGLRGGETYSMSGVLPPLPKGELPEELDVASGASSAGVDTDFLDARIDAWTSRAEGGAWSKLRAFATAMRTEGTYTDGGTPNSFEKVYLPGHAVSRLTRFVGSSKLAGNDEQYAATLALVGQRLGIPSRVVMGASTRPNGDIRGRDVRAWVEVRLDDGSWYPLIARTFVPNRDKTPSEQQLKTEEQKVGAQVPPPAGVSPPSVLQGPDQAQNATDVTKRKKNPFDVTAWPLWLQVVAGVVLVLALVALYVVVMRWLKRRRRRRHVAAGPVPGRAAWVWRDLVAEARSLHVAVPRGVTRREQAHAIDAAVLEASTAAAAPGEPAVVVALPDDVVTASSVAAAVDAVVFGPGDGDPAATDALHEHAEAALATMRSGVGRWTRIRSDADPRPLVVRRERTGPRVRWWRRLRVPSLPTRRGGSDPTPA